MEYNNDIAGNDKSPLSTQGAADNPLDTAEGLIREADRLEPVVSAMLQYRKDRAKDIEFIQSVRDGSGDDEETRFARADKYFFDRYGIATHRGAIINSGDDYKMRPFSTASAYESALITLAKRGYEGIASERYKALVAAERMGDAEKTKAEIIRLANIETEESVNDYSQTPSYAGNAVVSYPQIRRPRKQEDIDNDINAYRADVLGENYIALFEHFRPDLSEAGETIVRDVVKNGSLSPENEYAFMELYRQDPKQGDLVKFLCDQAKETKRDVGGAAWRGFVGMGKNLISQAGEKIGQGLYRFGAGLDAMDYAWTGSNADRLARMNRDERDEYERLRAEGMDEQKALDKVAVRMQNRYRDEELALSDRVRSRRAELALRDLQATREWEHYDFWDDAFIGAATTIPYMGATAIPYAGFAVNVFAHMQDVEDQIIREGGDPTKARCARAIGAVTWAAIEKMELKGFGRSVTALEKTVMWRHIWQGQMKLALGELGNAAKVGARAALVNWASETGQEGLQGAVEAIETDLGLGKDAGSVVSDAVGRVWQDAKDSAGTMAILSAVAPTIGAAARIPIQRRRLLDRNSLVDFIGRQEQLKNILAGYSPEQMAPEEKDARARKAYDAALRVWDDSATPMEAMKKFEEIGYTEDEAVKIAEYFDMRAEVQRNAALYIGGAEERIGELESALDAETDPEKKKAIAKELAGLVSRLRSGYGQANLAANSFRIGQDTTYNPTDLFHLINANIVTEDVMIPESDEEGAPLKKAMKVTVPMKDAQGNETARSFTVITDNSVPDIGSDGFAASVAQATAGTDAAITTEQYLALGADEKAAFLTANGLKHGGDFRVLDEQGKEIFNSDAVISIARANSEFVRKGGNWTLAHETAHAVVAFARQMGLFNDADTATMVKLFGASKIAGEAWDEEAMADKFADYLRGKFDFHGLSEDERGIVERAFDAVINLFKIIYAKLTGRTPDPTINEVRSREAAMDAVFEGIRTGDFSGLSVFAGIEFADEKATETSGKEQKAATPAGNAAKAAQDGAEGEGRATTSAEQGSAGRAVSDASAKAEERVKKTHAAQNGVRTDRPAAGQGDIQARLDVIESKLDALLTNAGAVAAGVPSARKTPKGAETRATPQGGVKFKIAWQWIPRAELVTSDRQDYPQEFQPRDRKSRVASDLQVIENTRPGRFDAMKLGYSYDSDGGAPIVAGGNIVLSGNGRSMMLSRLSQEGRYSEYLGPISQWAEDYGIGKPPAGMVEPVLVQRIVSTNSREDLLKIAELSNRPKILTRSEAENAEADAKIITPEMMRLFRPSDDGDLLAASNADFMQAFIAATPDAKGLTNADGTPTDQCARRVQNALISAVLGTDGNVRSLLQTLLEKRGDLGLGDLYRALIKASGALLSNRSTKASFDILPHVRAAVFQYVAWRSARLSNPRYTLDEHLRTPDMFNGEIPKETEAVCRLLEAGRFGRVIDKYNELVAQKAPDDQGMLMGFTEDTAYQTLAKAERSVLNKDEEPVTLDPADPRAAEPMQTPPAEPVAAPAEPEAEAIAEDPVEVAQEVIAPPEPTEFVPVPVARGTATVPAPNAEKLVAYQVNAEGQPTTTKQTLPVGAYNLLRGPYDVRKPPKPSVQDKAGRGLGIAFPAPATDANGHDWGDIFPHFQGNKTEMAYRTSQAVRKNMSRAEREHYRTVVDYFGGGGCWGLYHALTNFPNVDRLVINEWEPGRVEKIRLLHEVGDRVADMADAIIQGIMPELKRLCRVGKNGEESGSGTTIANKLESILPAITSGADADTLGALFAFIDCGHTMLANRTDDSGNTSTYAGVIAILDNLRDDGRKAKEAADAFRARGGQIVYRQGDAASFDDAPAGDDVVAVCDPPYYLTAGYNGQVSVPLDAGGMGWDYNTTRRLLDKLVDNGDAILYTDEAWWFKESYKPDQQEDMFTGASPFAQEQEILLGIINALDHFDVAGRVVGRQEVLGVHHGHQRISANEGAEGVEDGLGNGLAAGAEGQADGRRDENDSPRNSVRRVAAGAEGQDSSVLGAGADRGREGVRALAGEVVVQDICASIQDASPDSNPALIDRLVRHSVRSVREDRIAAYAKTVSKNAKAWLKRQTKELDKRMAEAGYTEKVWHGTEGEDFNVFKFSVGNHTVPAAYFTYNSGTAENYAVLRSMMADDGDPDATKPNIRGFYVNPGKCLEVDETGKATSFQDFVKIVQKAYSDGYNSVRFKQTFDDHGFRLGPTEELSSYFSIADAEEGLRTDILIVMQQPGDSAPARIKAGDPVTFLDDTQGELPIPLSMRANRDFPDLRFSVTMGKNAKEEARKAIEKYRPDLVGVWNDLGNADELFDFYVNQIASFETPKERKAALYWFCKASIRLPEDAPKIIDALKTAERAKVDPMQFERPGDILEQFAEYRPKEKPINPDKVPELTDRREMGHGIVTYLVQDDKAGQAAMRRIINTHFGKDASPWCLLQGDYKGNLTDDAWHYWNHYNALPKRVAFKDGKLVAFMATDRMQNEIDLYDYAPKNLQDEFEEWKRYNNGDFRQFMKWEHAEELAEIRRNLATEQWWDRTDEPHDGIPFRTKDGDRTLHQELTSDGKVTTLRITKGDRKADGVYEEWFPNATGSETYHMRLEQMNGQPVRGDAFYSNGQPKQIAEYKDDERASYRVNFDESGMISQLSSYNANGDNIICHFDENGVLHKFDLTAGQVFESFQETWNDDGRVAIKVEFSHDGMNVYNERFFDRETGIEYSRSEYNSNGNLAIANIADDTRMYLPPITREMIEAKAREILNGGIVAPFSSLMKLAKDVGAVRDSVRRGNLIAVKNISADDLIKDLKAGRSRNSSIGIIAPGTQFSEYGEITLVYDADIITKLNPPVWEGDGGTVVERGGTISSDKEIDGNGNRFTWESLDDPSENDPDRTRRERLQYLVGRDEVDVRLNVGWQYDEAKFSGDLDTAYIKAAIVPKDVSKKVLNALAKAGIPAVTYDGTSDVVETEGLERHGTNAADRAKKVASVSLSNATRFSVARGLHNLKDNFRYAGSVEEAGRILRASGAIGKPLTNTTLGMTVAISGNDLTKMMSEKATKKSVAARLHALAVANADTIFEAAFTDATHPDTKRRKEVSQVHRLGSALYDADRDRFEPVMITVVEYIKLGRKMYSIEAVDLAKYGNSAGQLVVVTDGGVQTPIAEFVNIIAYSVGEVNRKVDGDVASPDEQQLSSDNERIRHSIIAGISAARRSRRLGIDRLMEARKLLAAAGDDYNSDTRDDIYIKTGWWRGVDGKWRVEIPNVKPKAKVGVTDSVGLKINGLMPTFMSDGEDCKYCLLKDIANAPDLFAAYPKLKSIFVIVRDPDGDAMSNVNGFYDGRNINISWDAVKWVNDEPSNILTKNGVLTLTHEIQHVVQALEMFAYGGNEQDYGKRNYRRLAGEVEARNASVRNYGIYNELSGEGADDVVRSFAVANRFAPWQTEDIPQSKQIITYGDGRMVDTNGRPVARHSVLRAMRNLADGKEYGELHNEKFGTIRYPMGRFGKRGYGLLHIVEQRMSKDGAALDDAIDTAIKVGEAAEIGTETLSRYNTHHLDLDGTRAIIGEMPDHTIVITGYEIRTDDSVVANRRTSDVSPQPHVRSEEVIRALKRKLASTPDSIAYSGDEVNGESSARHSVRRGRNPANAEDVAVGFLASRFLAGKDVSVEDADKALKNIGLRVDAPSVLERARALAERNRDRLRAQVEAKNPEIVAELARANLADRTTEALNAAITSGAAAADPAIGVAMQRAADRFAARELQAAKGFTAAQMQAELPITLADAVYAVAEYEKSPEEKARIEAAKKKREEEKALADDGDEEFGSPVSAAERYAADEEYHEPTADERAYFDQLMDRAKFADDARKAEELRRKLANQKKAEEAGAGTDNNGEADDGNGEGGDSNGEPIMPFDTVKRIAPVFESADLFAQFVIEWSMDHIVRKHPELATREDLWKSPVAVRELVKTAQYILRDLSRQTLGSPSGDSSRNWVDQEIVNLADFKTFNAIRRNISFIYDRIHDNALRISRKKLVKELIYGKHDSKDGGPGFKGLRELAGAKGRFSSTTEAGKRDIDAKTELWVRWLIPYLTMTEERIQAENDRLQAIIKRHDTEDAEYGYNKEDNTDYTEAKDRLAILHKYGGMIRWLPGRIIDAREEILELVNGKRRDFEIDRAAVEEENRNIREAIIAAVNAGGTADFRKRSEAGDRLVRLFYSMNGNLTLEMQNLIRYCKDERKRRAALIAIDDLATMISLGTEKYGVTITTARSEINDGLVAYYGNVEVGIRHLMHDKIPEEAAKKIFTQSRERVQTYGQLLQLYATTLQADYKENAEKYGRTANLELMEQTLTPQDIAFHAWAVNWYAANRKALSDAVEEITGLGVTSPDRLYCPARMDRDTEGFAIEAVAWSPVPSALNRRVYHTLDFNEQMNFLSMLMEQAEVRAQTIGYGMTGIRLRDILAHHDLQKAVRKNVGRADMRLVTDHVKDVLVQGAVKMDVVEWLSPLNFARKWMARFWLSGNLPSALKQLASMPVWANAMLGGETVGIRKCLGYLTSVGTDAGREAIRELINSDGFKARYQMGWSEEVQNLLANPSKNRFVRYIEKAYDKGMLLNKGVDAISCLWMAQGFYRDARDMFERRGFDYDTAKRNALALTWSVLENGQQSGRIENMNRGQRRGGALVASLFQFKTAFLLQNNYVIQAIRDMRSGTPGARGRFARAMFINTVYIPAFVAVINALWGALMGEEPPDDPDKAPSWMKEFAWSMIEGVTAPLFLTGSIVHAGFNQLFGKAGYDDDGSFPAVSGIIRVGKHAGKVVADLVSSITPMEVAEEVTPEKVQEDVMKLLSDIAAPVRHIRRAVENRSDE